MYIFLINFFQKIIHNKYILWFLYYLITQNIITIAILPLYSSWGIAFYPLSIIGNFIFAPFLTIYIFLSTLIFIGFCFQLVSFQLIFLLKKLTEIWIYTMTSLHNFLPFKGIAFIDNPLYSYSLCWGGLLLFFSFVGIKKNIWHIFLITSFLLIFNIIFLSFEKATSYNFIVEQDRKKYLIRYIDEESVAIIVLHSKRKIINENDNEYLIKPAIIKKFGLIDPKIFIY